MRSDLFLEVVRDAIAAMGSCCSTFVHTVGFKSFFAPHRVLQGGECPLVAERAKGKASLSTDSPFLLFRRCGILRLPIA